MASLGAFGMIYPDEKNLNEILFVNNRFGMFLTLVMNSVIGLLFTNYLLHFG